MLAGAHVLIVQSEYLISLDIERMLEGAGAASIAFARTSEEGQLKAASWPELQLAIVEAGRAPGEAARVVEAWHARGVPLVLITTDTGLRHGLHGLPQTRIVMKPFTDQDLLAACTAALG